MSTKMTHDDRKEIVAEHETLTLTPRDWEVFLAALYDDRPRPRLGAMRPPAARRYLEVAGLSMFLGGELRELCRPRS